MKRVIYTCDKCGVEIEDVLYELDCWAEALLPGAASEAAQQNIAQNMARQKYTRHLCGVCKDKLTDGIFVV